MNKANANVTFHVGNARVTVDRETREVYVGRQRAALFPVEQDIIHALTKHPGAVLSLRMLRWRVYRAQKDRMPSIKTMYVHICTARKKLGRLHQDARRLIETAAKGYRTPEITG